MVSELLRACATPAVSRPRLASRSLSAKRAQQAFRAVTSLTNSVTSAGSETVATSIHSSRESLRSSSRPSPTETALRRRAWSGAPNSSTRNRGALAR